MFITFIVTEVSRVFFWNSCIHVIAINSSQVHWPIRNSFKTQQVWLISSNQFTPVDRFIFVKKPVSRLGINSNEYYLSAIIYSKRKLLKQFRIRIFWSDALVFHSGNRICARRSDILATLRRSVYATPLQTLHGSRVQRRIRRGSPLQGSLASTTINPEAAAASFHADWIEFHHQVNSICAILLIEFNHSENWNFN